MATKKGILSDANIMKNCLDYKALPVGFANAEFVGSTRNPFLDGIKTPKYQRSAPKPASADVVAVNSSGMYGGNKFVNARKILDQYQKEAKDFKPPPINPETLDPYEFQSITGEEGLFLTGEEARERYTEILEGQRRGVRTRMKEEQAVSILQRTFKGNRGDKITKQTISTQADDNPLTDTLYRQFYELPTADKQKEVSRRIYTILTKQGISPEDYGVSFTIVGTQGREKERADQTVRMVEALLARGGDTNEVLTLLSPISQLPAKQPISSLSTTASVAGASTIMSEAPTLQGIPEATSTRTAVEIEKK